MDTRTINIKNDGDNVDTHFHNNKAKSTNKNWEQKFLAKNYKFTKRIVAGCFVSFVLAPSKPLNRNNKCLNRGLEIMVIGNGAGSDLQSAMEAREILFLPVFFMTTKGYRPSLLWLKFE